MKVSDVTRKNLVDSVVRILSRFFINNYYIVSCNDELSPNKIIFTIKEEKISWIKEKFLLELNFSEINYSKKGLFVQGSKYMVNFTIHFKFVDVSKTGFKRLNIQQNFLHFKEIIPQLIFKDNQFSGDFVCQGVFERNRDINQLVIGSLIEQIVFVFESIVALWILLFTQKNDYARILVRNNFNSN